MRIYSIALATVFVVMQYMYWFGESGFFATRLLVVDVKTQADFNERLAARNDLLREEIEQIKTSDAYLETIAREELGMVKDDEKFYLIANE